MQYLILQYCPYFENRKNSEFLILGMEPVVLANIPCIPERLHYVSKDSLFQPYSITLFKSRSIEY